MMSTRLQRKKERDVVPSGYHGIRVYNDQGWMQVDSYRPTFSGTSIHVAQTSTTMYPDVYDPVYKGDVLFFKHDPDWHWWGNTYYPRIFISLEREYRVVDGKDVLSSFRWVRSRGYTSRTNWDYQYIPVRYVIIRPHNTQQTASSDEYGLKIFNTQNPADFTFDSKFFDQNIRVTPNEYFRDLRVCQGWINETGQAPASDLLAKLDDWVLGNFLDYNRIFDSTFAEVSTGVMFVNQDYSINENRWGAYFKSYVKIDLYPGDSDDSWFSNVAQTNHCTIFSGSIEGY